MALPSFHLYGIICQLMLPLYGVCVAVYPPTATSPDALPISPSPDNFLDHARRTGCRGITTVPAFLALWLNSPAAIAYLKTMDDIVSYILFLFCASLTSNSYGLAARSPKKSETLSQRRGCICCVGTVAPRLARFQRGFNTKEMRRSGRGSEFPTW